MFISYPSEALKGPAPCPCNAADVSTSTAHPTRAHSVWAHTMRVSTAPPGSTRPAQVGPGRAASPRGPRRPGLACVSIPPCCRTPVRVSTSVCVNAARPELARLRASAQPRPASNRPRVGSGVAAPPRRPCRLGGGRGLAPPRRHWSVPWGHTSPATTRVNSCVVGFLSFLS